MTSNGPGTRTAPGPAGKQTTDAATLRGPQREDKQVTAQGNRPDDDDIIPSWSEVELRIRVLLAEFRAELLADIYTRNLDPLKERVDSQDRYCAVHSQELTELKTHVQDLTEAKLIRRLEVAEARIGLIGRATVVTGTIAGTAVMGLIIALLTHQITL